MSRSSQTRLDTRRHSAVTNASLRLKRMPEDIALVTNDEAKATHAGSGDVFIDYINDEAVPRDFFLPVQYNAEDTSFHWFYKTMLRNTVVHRAVGSLHSSII